jgi:hypothetical protein
LLINLANRGNLLLLFLSPPLWSAYNFVIVVCYPLLDVLHSRASSGIVTSMHLYYVHWFHRLLWSILIDVETSCLFDMNSNTSVSL